MHFGTLQRICGGGGCPPITLNLEKDTRTSDYQSNEPPPKFIPLSFLCKPYTPLGITYNPCPDRWGSCHPQSHNFLIFQLRWTNGYLKFWLDVLREMVGVRGVLVVLQSISTIKEGNSPFNFQSNELFSKFLRQLLRYEVPLPKTKKKTLCQHHSSLRQRYGASYDFRKVLQCRYKIVIDIKTNCSLRQCIRNKW